MQFNWSKILNMIRDKVKIEKELNRMKDERYEKDKEIENFEMVIA